MITPETLPKRSPEAPVAILKQAITLRGATFLPLFLTPIPLPGLEEMNTLPQTAAEHNLQVSVSTLPFQQFHVLFHSLFKVLFIFPSLYLFAIGLSPIFSFRWNLPPTQSCIPKQLDSLEATYNELQLTGLSPSKALRSRRLVLLAQVTTYKLQLPKGISNLSSCRFTRRY